MRETHAMDHWITLRMFLTSAGAGALTTVALYVKQIRQLKGLLEAAHSNPKTEEQSHKLDGRKSA
jgi:hypothetical protein